jgi:hypothetical protein
MSYDTLFKMRTAPRPPKKVPFPIKVGDIWASETEGYWVVTKVRPIIWGLKLISLRRAFEEESTLHILEFFLRLNFHRNTASWTKASEDTRQPR